MPKKIWKVAPFLATLALFAMGCATPVRFEVPRTPTLDIQGISRVAVMPFEQGVGTTAVAQTLTSETSRRLMATNQFTMVAASTVNAVQVRGGDLSAYIDAKFTGRVTGFNATTTQRQQRRTVAGETVVVTNHLREVSISFDYFFINAHTGVIIGPVSRSGRSTSSNDNPANLTSYSVLIQRTINGQLAQFHQDVAPYTVRLTRRLESEPRNSPARAQMDVAEAQVRGQNFMAARQSYINIWEQHGSIAAAINASILFEAAGDLEGGIYFMENVFVATGAPRVNTVIARLNRELTEVMGLEAIGDARTAAERVTEHAIAEVQRTLQAGARLWIHNNATMNIALANDVTDNMVYTFLNAGYTVVERQLIDLIALEQGLHMDGSVADGDFVSIGNLAGANTVIVIGVSGSGPARRLQVRVLDIETGTVRMQSGTGVAWRI